MRQTQWSHSQSSIFFQSRVIDKNLFVASNDLWWPFKRLLAKNAPWPSRLFQIILIWTVPIRTHGSRNIFICLHWLTMERSRYWSDLTWSDLWQTLHADTIANFFRHCQLAWPGDLTWSDLGSKISHIVQNWCAIIPLGRLKIKKSDLRIYLMVAFLWSNNKRWWWIWPITWQ